MLQRDYKNRNCLMLAIQYHHRYGQSCLCLQSLTLHVYTFCTVLSIIALGMKIEVIGSNDSFKVVMSHN